MPAVGYGRLSPAAHRAKRELYLQLLAEVRRGVPHFQLRTGEELTDDHDRYLVWEPGPHWDRGARRDLLGEDAALNVRMTVTDNLGRVWRGSTPGREHEVRPPRSGATRQAPPPGGCRTGRGRRRNRRLGKGGVKGEGALVTHSSTTWLCLERAWSPLRGNAKGGRESACV